jgi:outer membrane protein assembly factor BamB
VRGLRHGALVLAALASGAAACAVPIQRRAGDVGEVGAALAHLGPAADGAPVNGSGRPRAYLAYRGAGGPEIGAYDLARATPVWKQPGELTGRIEVARSAIVHAAKGSGGATMLLGRDAADGQILWRHELAGDMRLIGYAADGDNAYYVVRAVPPGGGHGPGSLVALDATTGNLRWRHDLPAGDLGAPAARGGLVAVLVATQYVVLHDAVTGVELARILSNELPASFVRALPEGIFFGSKGIFRASVETAIASRRSAGFAQATLPRFVRPIYARDMYRPEQGDYSAIDRNRVLWRAAADPGSSRMAFRDGLVFVHDFRFFFAIDAASGALRWAHAEKAADAVASDHTGRALIYATTDGEIGALDPLTGREVYRVRVPGATMVRGATFDADGFRGVGDAATADAVAGTTPSTAGADLETILTGIIWDTDRRFSDDLAAFAVEELGKLPGAAVTGDLLKVVQLAGLATPARRKAEEALATRTDAASTDLLVQALEAHADYVDETRPTSVAAIARAAIATRSRPVALALARHLLRPETPAEAIVQISRAVSAAEATEAVPVLRDFVCLYRGEPAFDADPAALIAVASALFELGGAAERPLLLFVADESHTVEPLRRHLRQALAETISRAGINAP